jgi:predicted amidohydrolase
MRDLKLTTIQFPIVWENKQANLNQLSELILPLAGTTQLVVLPEMFNTGFSMNTDELAESMDGPTMQWMQNISQQTKLVITGSVMIRENGHCYNRLIWMLPNGHFGHYDKRHLFAYATEDQFFQAGQTRFIASVNGWKLNMQICYDLRFPVWSRQQEPEEFDVLVYVANWPARRSLAWQSLLRARAIENQCYVIGVNRNGIDGKGLEYQGDTMIIDPLGECLHHAGNHLDVFTTTLNREHLLRVREQFPFWKDADAFTIFPESGL